MFLTLIKTLIALQGDLSPEGRYPSDYGPNLISGDEFDFIIVGAGSAGSLVANRLSEIPEWKVLLLEAGGYPSGMSEIPGLVYNLQDTDENWQYEMEKSKTSCLGLKNNTCRCPRGKGLGGSSLINYMFYTRSNRFDHDRWVRAGNTGWDYDSAIKYYKKFENVHIENNKHYGTTGELHLTQYTSPQPLRQILENVYREVGYNKFTEDAQIGFKDLLLSINQGTRQNAAKAFLAPIKDRKNLYVATNSHVVRVLMNPDTLTAFGVEVKIANRTLRLNAKKEVILSAGSIHSPHILMHSGIGPKEHLSEIGIAVVKDLKVGYNYQDHLAFVVVAVGIDQSAVVSGAPFELVKQLYRFFMHRQGELTELGMSNFVNYMNTKNQKSYPNMLLATTLIHQNDPMLLQNMLQMSGITEDVSQPLLTYNQNSPIMNFIPVLYHPKSSGRVLLQNDDPFSKPLIVPNYLNDVDGEDIEDFLNAIKLIKAIVQTKALAPYNPSLIDLNITNCRDFVPQSDDFWKCAIRNIAHSLHHPVGTCKMGPESDSWAVVDPELRVHGVNRLRVIDASIMPTAPSCNTNAPAFMIGEKGADLVKKTWVKNRDEL